MNQITIVGLGSGDLSQMTLGTLEIIQNAESLILRTKEHPVVKQLEEKGIRFESLDDFYERHGDFETVYQEIVSYLIRKAAEKDVVYAVPGHPFVAEKTVQLLLEKARDNRISAKVAGGHSFLDSLFAALQFDPVQGFSLLDGTSFTADLLHPAKHVIICQVYSRLVASEVKLTLMDVYPDDFPVKIVSHAGIAGMEKIRAIPLYELDRSDDFDNLTAVYVPPAEDEQIYYRRFDHLKKMVHILRSPEGCPWDREQTHQSIRKNLIEETYEVLETIDEDNPDAMCEELGDLLLQIMLHAQMAEEDGYFTVYDVIQSLNEKLVRRHPHVFGSREAENPEQALANWEEIKAREKRGKEQTGAERSILDGIPKDLPATLYAWKLQKKAAKVGFDWDNIKDVYQKVEEEITELKEAKDPEEIKSELGDLLFAVVNLARFLDVDAEEALALANRKFKRRFRFIEQKLKEMRKDFSDTDLHEMEMLWQQAKNFHV